MADADSRKPSPWTLAGKKAVVTGATKGIGKAVVEELARLGASVYVCARSEDGVREAVRAWTDPPTSVGHVAGSACDVASAESRLRFMADVSQHFGGKLDILVNNVGALKLTPMQDITHEELSWQFRTNFESSFHLSQLAYPMLKASGEGSIVFISSIAGSFVSDPHTAVYGATKGALNQLTKSLACEWAKDHIRVNAVSPGYTNTASMQEAVAAAPQMEAQVSERIPLRRMARASEVAPTVAFLCMACSSYTTGSNFVVDGGMTAHIFTQPCLGSHTF